MQTQPWEQRVELIVDNRDHFKSVGNSRQAIECLMTCWPDKGGRAYSKAKKACMGSLNGRIDVDTAYAAFVAAAVEAGILRN